MNLNLWIGSLTRRTSFCRRMSIFAWTWHWPCRFRHSLQIWQRRIRFHRLSLPKSATSSFCRLFFRTDSPKPVASRTAATSCGGRHLNSRACSLTKILVHPRKKTRKNPKFQGFFLGFKIFTLYLGVDNSSNSVFKSFLFIKSSYTKKKIRKFRKIP